MELLVVTLAYTTTEHNTDVSARIQWIADTLRSAPGLVSSLFYRNRENSSSYLMCTVWEDEDMWQRAQERFNPRTLLQEATTGLLATPPEQWQMHYLWGYNRPTITPTVVVVHLATMLPQQAEISQQKWINELRKQEMKRSLGFAFLARGEQEETAVSTNASGGVENRLNPSNPFFLNLFSWGSETDCRAFYASPAYKQLDNFIRSAGVMHILFLEPI